MKRFISTVAVSCTLLTLAGCGGSGSGLGAPHRAALTLHWVDTPDGTSGTERDALHFAYAGGIATLTATENGTPVMFTPVTSSGCFGVNVGAPDDGRGGNLPFPAATAYVHAFAKQQCAVTVTSTDGAVATLQVYSEL